MFYVKFGKDQQKFVDVNEMRLKWPWVAVQFLEPQLRELNPEEPCNQMCMFHI